MHMGAPRAFTPGKAATMTDQRNEVEIRLATVAPQVAAELGDGWRAQVLTIAGGEACPHCWHLTNPDGRKISMLAQYPLSAKGRVRIVGSLPGSYSNHGITCEDITVSVARDGRAIAGEIRRRLLPAYAVAFAKATDAVASARADEAAAEETARMLAEVMGVAAPRRNGVRDELRLYLPDDLASYGFLRVQSGGSVRIEASLSAEQARAVLWALRALLPR
jgi:hypothetical protein